MSALHHSAARLPCYTASVLNHVVTHPFSARKQSGWYHQFEIGDVLQDCTVREAGDKVTCYADTSEERERFEIDLQLLRSCTKRV